MKKLIYCALALAAGLFAASCQQENLEPVAQENTVTYTVELPDVQTKTIGDGLNVDQLVYEVWKTGEEGKLLTRLYQKTINLPEGAPRKWIVTLNLVQNQTYKALFWAQVGKPKGHENYNTDQLTNVYYAYDVTKDYSSNQESYAAFYGTDVLDTNTPLKGKTITLTRPFAQLNIGTLNTALEDEYTIDMLQSSVEVTVPTHFNVATSEVANTQKISFALADVPTETLPVSGQTYDYVAMNYVFAGVNTTSSVEYTINTTITPYGATEGTPATINKTVPNVPLKENYRTNIVGNLLTSSAQYEVVIDKEFNNPENVIGEEWTQTGEYTYTILEGASALALNEVLAHANSEAKAAATKSEGPVVKINLASDVVWKTGAGIGSTPLLPADSPISAVVINGNGKTFTATGDGVGQIRLANGALLTFNKVKVVDHSVSYVENSWEYGYLEFGGNLAFNECQFVNAIMMESENAAFTNCSFNSNKDNEYAVWVSEGNTTFNGCTFTGARGLKVHEAYGSEVASVVVNDCTFGPLTTKPGIALGDLNAETSVTISNSTFDGCQAGDQSLYMYETDTDVTTFTFETENNIVVPSGDEVIEQGEGVVMVATAAGFAKAIEEAEAGDVIKVAGSVVLPTGVNTKTAGALTIEGYTEDAEVAFSSTPGGGDGGLNCYADGMDLLFKNITVVSPNTGSAYTGGFGRAKSVTFENCEYIGQYRAVNASTKFIECTIDPQTSYIYTDYANVDFEDCVFNCSEGKGVQVYNDGNTTNTVINVTNCTFTAAKQGATWDGKPVTAIDINSNGEIFTVNITNTTAKGFPEGLATASPLFNFKGGAEYVTVMIDGNKFISNGLYEDQQGNAIASSQAALLKALGSEAKTIALAAGEYTFPASSVKAETTIICEEGTVFKGNTKLNIKGSTVIGATFSNPSGTAVDQTINGVFKNCTFTGSNGVRWGYAGETCVFEDCVFSGDVYGFHTDGGAYPITFTRCEFSGFNAFAGATPMVTFNDCVFKSNGKSGYNGANLWGNTKMINTEFTFDGTASTEWVDICGASTNSYSFNGCTVCGEPMPIETIGVYTSDNKNDEVDITFNGITYENYKTATFISTAEELFAFANEVNVNKNAFNGKTVYLMADIDLNNAAWTPVGQTGATTFNGVFDGQNHTIYNLNVNSEAQTGKHYSSGLFGWVESHTAGHGHLKNVTISGAVVNGHHNCGALVGYITQETALVENCHVTGATITCTKANDDADGDKAGALIGNATVATPVKDCTAANSTVSAGRDAGQVIGAGKEANVTGCSATEVAVSANGTSTGNNVRNEVIGRLL